VLGGVELGDDPDGFSGYGPARYFRAAQVRELSEELRRPEVESEAVARFDPAEMSQLQIYPGWRAGEQDKEWLMIPFGAFAISTRARRRKGGRSSLAWCRASNYCIVQPSIAPGTQHTQGRCARSVGRRDRGGFQGRSRE
jgi:hypothetical protein